MKRELSLAVFVVLPACGGEGGGSGNPAALVQPTVNYSGTYSGTMVYYGKGRSAVRPIGGVTVTHTGSAVTLGNLFLTSPVNTHFPMGAGTLVGDSANIATSYEASGCGTVTSQSAIRFAGNLVNVAMVLTSTGPGPCARSEIIRGELERSATVPTGASR
jgi:hypothetical protein